MNTVSGQLDQTFGSDYCFRGQRAQRHEEFFAAVRSSEKKLFKKSSDLKCSSLSPPLCIRVPIRVNPSKEGPEPVIANILSAMLGNANTETFVRALPAFKVSAQC